MYKTMKKLFAVVMAIAMIAVLSVASFADYVSIPRYADVDGDVIDGIIGEDGSMTVSVQVAAGDNSSKSINYYIKGDALDGEFWNRNDAFVEIDLTLQTESSTVFAIIPAFAEGWKWVNPSVWGTMLKNGQTVTIREPLSTYYTSFKTAKPMLLRVQIGSNSTEPETVQIALSGLRFVGVGDTVEQTTTTAATTVTEPEPADTEPEPDVTEPDVVTTEAPAEDEPETTTTTTTAATTTTAPAEDNNSDDAAVTSASSSATQATTTRAAANVKSNESSVVGMLIVIIVVAAVIVAGAIVGYIIYRNKKYY